MVSLDIALTRYHMISKIFNKEFDSKIILYNFFDIIRMLHPRLTTDLQSRESDRVD